MRGEDAARGGSCTARTRGGAHTAAQVVARDVAAVDVNMGCPKRLALASGTGAALGDDPPRAAAIVAALRRAPPHPTPARATPHRPAIEGGLPGRPVPAFQRQRAQARAGRGWWAGWAGRSAGVA